jgi:5-methyltetrahydrofolate--homocysteine methyltransferase
MADGKNTKNTLIVIGENINTTRRIKATSKNIVKEDGKVGYAYTDSNGNRRLLDMTDVYPEDPAKVEFARISPVGQGVLKRDVDFISWAILSQKNAGAHIIDLCVDELSVYPEERMDHMRWIVKTAQSISDTSYAIDSSDPETIRAGLEVYDKSKGQPAINSVSLEPGRDVLIPLGKDEGCYIFANGSGDTGMPQDAAERIENISGCMELMDKANVPMENRFLDPLVFPVGAGPQYGKDYLDAVKGLRAKFPEVHIFGGLSNVSFGMPRRKLLNHAFITLAIIAGCDSIMIDPLMNPPTEYVEFLYAARVMTGEDEYALRYLKFIRSS